MKMTQCFRVNASLSEQPDPVEDPVKLSSAVAERWVFLRDSFPATFWTADLWVTARLSNLQASVGS